MKSQKQHYTLFIRLVIGAVFVTVLITAFGTTTVIAASNGEATLRQGEAISNELHPPIISKVVNTDIKQKRNYPMQPPTIPHKITNYQIDLNTNKCLSCHNRSRIVDSQAPMVSVTHYMNREGNFLATVSPRRYFCLQCHVIQVDVKPLVGNDFIDMDHLIKNR